LKPITIHHLQLTTFARTISSANDYAKDLRIEGPDAVGESPDVLQVGGTLQ